MRTGIEWKSDRSSIWTHLVTVSSCTSLDRTLFVAHEALFQYMGAKQKNDPLVSVSVR